MKNYTFTLLLGWMLFLSSNLFAQNAEGRFRLKEGDWFEVQVEQKDTSNSKSITIAKKDLFSGTSLLLRYQLEKQLPNKNQQYKVTLEHVKILRDFGSITFGFDSRYPTFEENKKEPDVKNQFNMEVTPTGDIVRFYPIISNKSIKVTLSDISSVHNVENSFTIWDQLKDKDQIKKVSTILFQQDSAFNANFFSSSHRIPLILDNSGMVFHLTNASFPLSNNAIIQGKIIDQINQNILITLIGEYADYYFPEKQFRTNGDGSFNCPIFLKRPFHLRIQVGNKTLTTFMEPGDTLNISAIGHQAREIQNNQYTNTKPNEYFLPGLNKSDYFSGIAAYNTMLSNELDQYRNGIVYEPDTSSLIINYKKKVQSISQLIESYRGKVSDECISYFEHDMNYFSAAAKLLFREEIMNQILEFNNEDFRTKKKITIRKKKWVGIILLISTWKLIRFLF